MPSLYDVLGVDRTVSADELRVAFKRRALAVHPDKGGVKEEFVLVMVAFETLSDPVLRKRYDRKEASAASPSNPASAMAKAQASQPTQNPTEVAPSVARPSRSAGAAATPARKRQREANGPGSAHSGVPEVSPTKATVQAAKTTRTVPTGTKIPAKAAATPSTNATPPPPAAASPTLPGAAMPQRRVSPRLDRSTGEGVFLNRIFRELRRLLPMDRRRFIKKTLSEAERLKLEEFITRSGRLDGGCGGREGVDSNNIAQISTSEPAEGPLGAADRESDDSYDDLVENSDQSEWEEDDSDGVNDDDARRQLVTQGHDVISDEMSDEDGNLLALNDRDSPTDVPADVDCVEEDEPNDFLSEEHFPETKTEQPVVSSDSGSACRNEYAVPRPTGSPADHSHLERSSNRTSVRGLITRPRGKQTYYQACLNIESLTVLAREIKDLSTALDRLVILTTIRQRTRESTAETLGERIREGFACAEGVHGVTVADLELRFKAEISKSLFAKGHLDTPVVHDLDVALATVERLAPYRNQACMNQHTVMRYGLLEMEMQWASLRACYLDILQDSGLNREQEDARLKIREDSRRPFREMQITAWNRRRMAVEEASQRRFASTIKRRMRREHYRMVNADRQSRRLRRHNRRKEHITISAQRLLRKLLYDWRRQVAIGEKKQQQMEERRAQKERADRWRAMNRPDLTMADILERRWTRGSLS